MSENALGPRPGGAHRGSPSRAPVVITLVVLVIIAAVVVFVVVHSRGGSSTAAPASSSSPAAPAPTAAVSSAPASSAAVSSAPASSADDSVAALSSAPPVSSAAATSPVSSAAPSPTTSPSTSPSSTPAPSPTVAQIQHPDIDVFNSTHVNGLAASAASKFEASGWTISSTGNYQGAVQSSTTVYFAADDKVAAQRLAGEFPRIDRVVEEDSLAAGGRLHVVLGTDWAS